ncbi:MAG: hypothetical protein CM15mP85_17210 [Rhodobacterales bacterium]|nr:MAG: hypothetical protein CM15mP85_17210 [Rhodobacterales bacterium]
MVERYKATRRHGKLPSQTLGVIVEGTITCRHDDGSEITYTAGDAYSIEPGHDAWVVGDKKAIAYEFHGLWGETG